ncbi:MAG: DNA-directed RNA polymerase subunit omega [Thermovirgaceae bacterium]|nr:DNA-directed RNA polymerase subunit omega [Synergistales bacterium]HPC76114.1 DNA-directed RNA polymerase subunit omega [Synergistales bacterium]HRS48791.1 DNA-directed RNA polymerase subunit omega [Thermovirgaceae bacterium]HRU90995.1 DNA-directed RNA polymerase subunit omega [Thermovirgaceae bacterium]
MTKKIDRANDPSILSNKYLLACIIAKRARQLSEKKGRLNLEEGDLYFNPIQQAVREIEEGKIIVETPETGLAATPEGDDKDVPGVEKGS